MDEQDVTTTGEPTCYRHSNRITYLSCSECGKSTCPDCSYDSHVGQKCAECSQHTGRGKVASAQDARQNTLVVTTVIVTSVVVYLAQSQSGACTPFLDNFTCDFGQFNPAVRAGEWWRVLSAAFLHGGIWHVGLNMYVLYILGPSFERQVGSAAFAGLYFASAIGGGAAYLYFGTDTGIAVGASGAIWGLFGGLLIGSFRNRHLPGASAQLQRVGLLLVLNLALPLFIPNVAWQAHLGGGLVGIIVVGLWHQLKPSPRINTVRSAISYGVGVLAMVMVLLA